MRTCFTNSADVAHLWAHQIQNEARYSGGNFYFHGDTIYSYGSHFPCGKIVRNLKGDVAYVINSNTYSNTTSKHQALVFDAIPSYATYFTAPSCAAPEISRSGKYLCGYWSAIEVVVAKLKTILSLIEKQRKARTRDYKEDIRSIISDIHDWIQFWNLDKKQKWQIVTWDDSKKESRQDIFTAFKQKNFYYDVHVLCRTQLDESVNIIALFNMLHSSECLVMDKSVVLYEDIDNLLQQFWGIELAEEIQTKQKKVAQIARNKKRQQERNRIKKDLELLEKWHNHDHVNSWHPSYEFIQKFNWHTALRINEKHIVTSKGISISFEEAKRLWKLIHAFHCGTPFRHDLALSLNGQAWKLNKYENDILTAGCHEIPYSECERIAKLMNW